MELTDIKTKILDSVQNAQDLKALDDARVAAMGKKGVITDMMKNLTSLSVEEKKEMGKTLNLLKTEIETAIENKKTLLEKQELDAKLKNESIDVSLPCRPETLGKIHPVSKIYEEVVAIFGQMGFEVAEGPDIEDQFHNFNALNMPANHPARQMQDTFYIPNPDSADFDDDLNDATAVDAERFSEHQQEMAKVWSRVTAGVLLFLLSFLI